MKKIVLAAIMTAAVGGASAQAYVGGAYGQTHLGVDCSGWSSCATNDTGYKGYVGFVVNQYVAIEAGYANFGRAAFTAAGYGVSADANARAEALYAVGAFRLAFVPNVPELTGVVRVGMAEVHTRLTVDVVNTNDSNVNPRPFLGLGLEYALTQRVKATLDADFTRSTDVPFGGLNGTDSGIVPSKALRMVSVGAQYRF